MEIQSEGSSMLEAGLTCLIWLLSDSREVREEAPHTGSLGETDCGEGTLGGGTERYLTSCVLGGGVVSTIWGRAESPLERSSRDGVGRGGGAPNTNNLKTERSCASGHDIITSLIK